MQEKERERPLVSCRGLWGAIAALAVASPALQAASEEAPPFEWTCKAHGFFEMKVFPDGKTTPIADASLTEPISIVIQKRPDEYGLGDQIRDMIFPFDDHYIVGITSKQTNPFTIEANELETAGVHFEYGKNGLHKVEALYVDHYRSHILTLKPADQDWVFSVYTGSLTTDSEARRLNIEVPGNRVHFNAEANVYFLTGPCIRRR